jgi:hypothetical protein
MRSYLISGAAALALCAALPAAAQTMTASPSRSAPPASSTASPPASTAVSPPASTAVNPPLSTDPATPPATTSPGTTSTGAVSTGAAIDTSANAPITSGLSVKDNTGATIGQITQLKPEAGGKQTATIKMGADSFAVDTSALVVQNGVAVINSSQAELKGMIKKATPPAPAATPEATKPKTKKK